MPDLGPGPRRWARAQEAYAKAMEERNRNIGKAIHQGLGSAEQIARAYGIVPSRAYQIAAAEKAES